MTQPLLPPLPTEQDIRIPVEYAVPPYHHACTMAVPNHIPAWVDSIMRSQVKTGQPITAFPTIFMDHDLWYVLSVHADVSENEPALNVRLLPVKHEQQWTDMLTDEGRHSMVFHFVLVRESMAQFLFCLLSGIEIHP